ncbi:MAG: hypothetical protein Kow0092_15140 [Deferrisomatales bacterium]
MIILQATVEAGRREAAGFVVLPWVTEGIRERYGFVPFPGTLNLRLADEASAAAWLRLQRAGRGTVLPPGAEGFCEAWCVPVRIDEAADGVVVAPRVPGYPEDLIEILAPERVRDRLGLRDGDRCRVAVLAPVRHRCVLFDLEGTLVDFQWRLEPAEAELRGALRAAGYDPAAFAGQNYAGIRHRALDRAADAAQRAAVDRCLDPVYDRYDLDAESRWTLREDARELLARLRAAGVAAGLVTNIGRRAVDRVLHRTGLADAFTAVVTRNDVERMKPSGEGIGRALAALGAEPGQALMVGDSLSDLLAARDAGVEVALVAGGESLLRGLQGHRPDHSLARLGEVAHLVFPSP